MSVITTNTIVTLTFSLSDTDGKLLMEQNEQLHYIHGGYGSIFAPVEAALDGKTVGDSVTVKLQPAEAFGEYDPALVDMVPLEQLPQPVTVGMHLEGTTPDGDGPPAYATVTDIAEGKAVIDANHPLAGMALIFSGSVVEVRAADAEQIALAAAHLRH